MLLAVIFILLALFLAAGAYFGASGRTQLSSQTLASQQIAISRAEFAAQRAVRDIRGRVVIPSALFPRPTPNGIPDCGGNCIFQGPLNGPLNTSPFEGGGQLWDYVVWRPESGLGVLASSFRIQGNGYFGTPGSSNFTTARVEVEIEVDQNSGNQGDGNQFNKYSP